MNSNLVHKLGQGLAYALTAGIIWVVKKVIKSSSNNNNANN